MSFSFKFRVSVRVTEAILQVTTYAHALSD